MPFRERVRRVFGRSSSSEDSPTDPSKEKKKSKSKKKKDEQWEDWPEHIYKPHEMPRPKYRRPPEPAHKDKLEAYNWESNTPPDDETADRRKSNLSLYSPMGSRLPSRMGSIASKFGKSRNGSRVPSIVAEGDGDEDGANGEPAHSHTRTSSRSQRRGSGRMSYSRPGTSVNQHPPPLVENSSGERSKADTPPRQPIDDESELVTANGLVNGSIGADLTQTETVTEAREQQRRMGETTDSATRRDVPFTTEELDRAFTNMTVRPVLRTAISAA